MDSFLDVITLIVLVVYSFLKLVEAEKLMDRKLCFRSIYNITIALFVARYAVARGGSGGFGLLKYPDNHWLAFLSDDWIVFVFAILLLFTFCFALIESYHNTIDMNNIKRIKRIFKFKRGKKNGV